MRKIYLIENEKMREIDFLELKKGEEFKIVDEGVYPEEVYLDDIKNDVIRVAESDPYFDEKLNEWAIMTDEKKGEQNYVFKN